MESHWWHDQLVSSLLKPSTGEARMHASGGRSWNSLEFSRLASHMCKEHLQEIRSLRLKVCDFRQKWPIVQQIPTFKLVNFWTANLSWFSKVRISSDCICHIPEFYLPCCNDVVAKNPIWLVSLLLLHRVVKARFVTWLSWAQLIAFLWTLLSALLPQGIKYYRLHPTAQPSNLQIIHDIFVFPHIQTITKSSQSYSQSVPMCQSSAISITQAQATLTFSTALISSATTWAPCFLESCPMNSHCIYPGQSKPHIWACCSLLWTFRWLLYDMNVLQDPTRKGKMWH